MLAPLGEDNCGIAAAKFCKSIGGVPLANHNFRAESLFFCSGSALAAIRGCSSTSTLAQLGYTESTVYVL